MNIIQTNTSRVLFITPPRVFNDSCGYFFESFSQKEFYENRRTKQEQGQTCLNFALQGGERL